MKESIICVVILMISAYLYIKFELWFWNKSMRDIKENIEEKDDKKGLRKTKKK